MAALGEGKGLSQARLLALEVLAGLGVAWLVDTSLGSALSSRALPLSAHGCLQTGTPGRLH